MARLTDRVAIDLEFSRILQSEKLDDPSQFFRKDFFDEIPLYSRYSQLSFLGDLDPEQVNRRVVGFSLDYLNRLIHHGTPSDKFLAAVTYNNYCRDDFLVPHIFVCHGEIELLHRSGLVLKEPKSVFANRIICVLNEIQDAGDYQVLQDTVTIPRKPRVFIGPKRLPHPLMVGIEELSSTHKTKNGRAARV